MAEAAELRPGGAAETPAKEGKKAAPRTRKKKEPPRLCARWGVFDSAMKQVAVFDYGQRALADQKAAELSGKKGGSYFVQLVKEPMVKPDEGEE